MPRLSAMFNIDTIGYFGSYAKGSQTEKSDIDILVSFKKPIGWEFFELQDLLEKELHIKVDLVTQNALKAQLKDQILSEVKYI